MLILLSPSKTLNVDCATPQKAQSIAPSSPFFLKEAQALIHILKNFSPQEIAELMRLSDKLALLNFERFQNWEEKSAKSKPALFLFQGDVYEGLNATSLQHYDFLNAHLFILSGLYGALRPFDSILPYRLEMGTPLKNEKGKDLYAFWGEKIARFIEKTAFQMGAPFILNLASQEYFKAVEKHLTLPVVECVFEDEKNKQFKIISFYAKRARGLMARFIAENQIQNEKDLPHFDEEGYRFCAASSSLRRFVFRRDESARP